MAGRSGQVAVALGVSEGQEVLEFLIGLEGVSSEIVERAIGAGCTHWDLRRVRLWLLSSIGAAAAW
jgi:hypothetical protein